MLIALVPVVKLAMLGPVDSMKTIEVAAIWVGIAATTALSTTVWIGTQDVLVARSGAAPKVAAAAERLATNISGDLRRALFSDEMRAISTDLANSDPARLVHGFAPNRAQENAATPQIAVIENLVLLDANGRQALGTSMKAARDYVGTNFDLSDRHYFRRARNSDFAPRTRELASRLRHKYQTDPCSIWNDVEGGLVFDQIGRELTAHRRQSWRQGSTAPLPA